MKIKEILTREELAILSMVATNDRNLKREKEMSNYLHIGHRVRTDYKAMAEKRKANKMMLQADRYNEKEKSKIKSTMLFVSEQDKKKKK